MRTAYYHCGGSVELDDGERPPSVCPEDDCGAGFATVVIE